MIFKFTYRKFTVGIFLILVVFCSNYESRRQYTDFEVSLGVPVAHAATLDSFSFATLWSDILDQIDGVFAFTAQAIRAVVDIQGTSKNTAELPIQGIAEEDATGGTLKTGNGSLTSATDFLPSQTGSLVVNVPLIGNERLTVVGESNFGSTTVERSLSVLGGTTLGSLLVGAQATIGTLEVSAATTLSRLIVRGRAALGSLQIGGITEAIGSITARGGITTEGADVNLGSGKIYASNVVNSITAGKNVTITGSPANPIISVRSMVGGGGSSGVDSVNGESGGVTLLAGDDISITGLTIAGTATLATVRTRGGCTGCITDADVLDALTISGGTIDNTVIGGSTPAAASFSELTVTGTATSSFGGGIDIASGCFAIAGTCIATATSSGVSALNDLSDVVLGAVTSGDVLMYNGSSWVDRATSTLGLGDGTFLGLRDTPDSFISGALSFVNATGSGLTQSANLVYNTTGLAIGTSTPLNKLSINGSTGILNQNQLRFYDSNSSNYVAFRASSTVSSNVSWILPSSDGTSDQVLVTNGSGGLRFASVSAIGGGVTTFLDLDDTADAFINKAIPYVATGTLRFSSGLTFDGRNLTIGTDATSTLLTAVGSVRFGPSISSPTFVYNHLSDQVGIGTATTSALLTIEQGSVLQQGASVGGSYVPTQVGSTDLPDNANDVFVAGKFAYIVSGSGGDEFSVVDITNAAAPLLVGSADLPASANSVYVSGKYAYAVSDVTGDDFHIINISDSGNPFVAGSLNLPTSAFGVTVQGRYAYVTTAGAGDDFHVIDISNPLVPSVVGSLNLPTAANAVAVSGSYAYVAVDSLGDEFYVIDIRVPSAPVTAGSANLSSSATDVAVQGNYAYVTTSSVGDDLHVIDISSPASPVEVEGLGLSTGANAVALAGDYAYVTTAGTGDDVHVININNPLSITEIGSEELASGSGLGIATAGTYAYVVTSSVGDDLHVIDVTGVKAQSVFASSFQAGELSVFGDIVTGGNVSFGHGLRAGVGGLQTDGSLFVSGTSSSFFLGNVGIGTSTPAERLTVAGNLRLTGALYDSTNSAGTTGMVLQSTGSGQRWVATSTLGLGGSGGLATTDIDTCSELAAIMTGETGTCGSLVFSNAPTLSSLVINSGGINITGNSTSTGHFLPGADDTYDLGSSAYRFRDLYLGGDTLHLGTSLTDEATFSYNTTSNIFNIGTDSTTNGDIAFFTDDFYLDKSTGRVGVGTTTPSQELTIVGDIRLTGSLYDAVNSAGSSGMVLQSTGSGFRWVATSTLGLAADTPGVVSEKVYSTSTQGTTTVQFTGAIDSEPSFSGGVLTLPSNTSSYTVELWGGGGSGGSSNSGSGAGGGGGGGGYTKKIFYNTATKYVTVGAGGAQTANEVNTAGNVGGSSCFGSNAVACTSPSVSAGGGGGGEDPDGGVVGSGGTSSGGEVNKAGGDGGPNAAVQNGAGGGGSAGLYNYAHIHSDGSDGAAGTDVTAGVGGDGVGAGADGGTGNGSVGNSPGGGGSGGAGHAGSGSIREGGAGAPGGFVITLYTAAADLAEMYPIADASLEAGDIVAFDDEDTGTITLAERGSLEPIVGIISTLPGIVLGQTSNSQYRPVALSGRVPTKVNLEGGLIAVGDRIALSSVKGVGKKASYFESSVGIAMAPFGVQGEDIETVGTVLVFMDLQQGVDVSDLGRTLLGLPTASSTESSPFSFITELVNSVGGQLGLLGGVSATSSADLITQEETFWSKLVALANNFINGVLQVVGIQTQSVTTDQLCVGRVCVTENEFIKVFGEEPHIDDQDQDIVPEPVEEELSEEEPVEDDEVFDEEQVIEVTEQDSGTTTEDSMLIQNEVLPTSTGGNQALSEEVPQPESVLLEGYESFESGVPLYLENPQEIAPGSNEGGSGG